MDILITVNENFIDIAEEAIFSISYNNKEHINFYLMYAQIPQPKIDKLRKFIEERCNNSLYPIKFSIPEVTNIPQILDGTFVGIEAYYRIFAPFVLPQELDKILYLDVDLICTGSLKELYDEDLEDNYYIAASDSGVTTKDLIRLDIPTNYTYINNGVTLINLKKIREDFTIQQIIDLIIEQSKDLLYLDQDFMNKNFYNKIKTKST